MANKITTVVDFVTDKAGISLKSLKQNIDDADGAGGKLKAGFKGVSDGIQANAGAVALGAGGALVAFGVKAVGAFTETAKAAIDLGAATGLSTEAASRWIGVGDDFQVSAEDLTSSIGKIGKTLDGASWDKYGIATRDAGGHARSTNDILVDAMAKLSGITNATERAKAGNELFGKGYAKLAPLIGHTKDEYEGMLGSVEKGQVITEAEAAKAERFRLAQDELGDALHEVTLAVGEQVASLAPLLTSLAKLTGLLGTGVGTMLDFNQGAGDVINALEPLHAEAERGGKSWYAWRKEVLQGKITLDDAVRGIHDAAAAHDGLNIAMDGGEKSWEDYGSTAQEAASETARETRALGRATGDLTDPIELGKRAAKMMTDSIELGLNRDKAALDNLKGSVDDHAAWTNLELEFMSVQQAGVDMADAVKHHTDDAAQKTLEYSAALDGLKSHVIDYATEVLKLPVERVTKIVAAVDPQSLDDVEALLAALTRNRTVNVGIQAKGGPGYNDTGTPHFAQGGMVPGGRGQPSLAVVHGGETITQPGMDSGGGPNVTINVTTGQFFSATEMYRTGQLMANALAEYNRRNG